MASVGALTQINHPIFKDALAASVAVWKHVYEKHECELRAISQQHSDEEELTALPFVACVAPRLLCGLVAMGVFPGRDDPSEVTSDDVQEGVASAAKVDDGDVAATVKAALSTVACTPQPGDALGCVRTYFVDAYNAFSDTL